MLRQYVNDSEGARINGQGDMYSFLMAMSSFINKKSKYSQSQKI